jgi:hypothetical protein
MVTELHTALPPETASTLAVLIGLRFWWGALLIMEFGIDNQRCIP